MFLIFSAGVLHIFLIYLIIFELLQMKYVICKYQFYDY